MRDLFFQIVLFVAGALIGVAVPLLPKIGQKWVAGILSVLLVATALIWAGFEIGIQNAAPTNEAPQAVIPTNTVALTINTPTASDNPDLSPTVPLPLLAKGNITIEEFGTERISLSGEEIAIGTADRFQDKLEELNPPFTIFIIYGPLDTDISLWWGGWDIWENASAQHIENEILGKIEEVKQNHPEDYKSRGYRVIKCNGQVSNCEVINTYP